MKIISLLANWTHQMTSVLDLQTLRKQHFIACIYVARIYSRNDVGIHRFLSMVI
jgi:hypothetical protein